MGRSTEAQDEKREGEAAGGSTWGEHGLSPADHVQEPNLPLKAVGAVAEVGSVGVTRPSLGLKTGTLAAVQGTAWKKAGVKTGRSLRSDGSSFTLGPQCLVQRLA